MDDLIKNSGMVAKEHWWPKRRIYYCGTWRRLHWKLKDDPITEGPKENPINKKPKEEDTITLAPIDNSINEDPQELQDPQ